MHVCGVVAWWCGVYVVCVVESWVGGWVRAPGEE